MKNIVIFYPSFERGGATKVLINLIKFFSKKKIKVFLISNKKDQSLKNIKNLKIIVSKSYNFNYINNRISSGISSIISLKKLINNLDSKETIILSMQSNFFPAFLSFFLNWKVFTRVSEDPCDATKFADNKFFAYLILITKFLTYNFSYKVVVNATKSKKCVEKFLLNKKKVVLLFNPSLSKIIKRKNNYRKNYILNVGRLCKQKNQSLLIDAFYIFYKKNKKYKLLFCGDGPDKKKLIKQVDNLQLSKNIKFLGWSKNLDKIYKNSKLFILTSYYEGMPNALIEAINYELPSIALNSSGVEDVLLNGKGGEILYDRNIKVLANKMSQVILNYKKILKKTKKSKKKIDQYYIEKAGQKYINNLCK